MKPRTSQAVFSFILVSVSILEGKSTAIFEVENNCLTYTIDTDLLTVRPLC